MTHTHRPMNAGGRYPFAVAGSSSGSSSVLGRAVAKPLGGHHRLEQRSREFVLARVGRLRHAVVEGLVRREEHVHGGAERVGKPDDLTLGEAGGGRGRVGVVRGEGGKGGAKIVWAPSNRGVPRSKKLLRRVDPRRSRTCSVASNPVMMNMVSMSPTTHALPPPLRRCERGRV